MRLQLEVITMEKIVFICSFFFLLSSVTPYGESSTEECRVNGFIKSQLMCSSCEKLHSYGIEKLKPYCFACCQDDNVESTEKRYAKAILEVCTCKFRAYPQIQAFIKSERPAKFPNLQIKYVRGLDPMVKMLDRDGNVKETLSIAKWNTDTVQEFFETHLENGKRSKVDEMDNEIHP